MREFVFLHVQKKVAFVEIIWIMLTVPFNYNLIQILFYFKKYSFYEFENKIENERRIEEGNLSGKQKFKKLKKFTKKIKLSLNSNFLIPVCLRWWIRLIFDLTEIIIENIKNLRHQVKQLEFLYFINKEKITIWFVNKLNECSLVN